MLKRSITGFILGLIMICGMLYTLESAGIVMLIILAFSAYEWHQNFINKTKLFASILFGLIHALLLVWIVFLILTEKKEASFDSMLKFDFILVLILGLFGFSVFSKQAWNFSNSWFSGIFYIGLPILMGIVFLNQNFELNKFLLLSFIIINWSNDTFAYIIGKQIGKTPLAKSISPNKTIEGTMAGLLAAILAAILLNHFLLPESLSITKAVILGMCIGIAGTTGDLYESKMKRLAGIKDSGHLLPGHGGFLDRFDSFFYIVPVGILVVEL